LLKNVLKRKIFPFITSTIHEKVPAGHGPQTERNLSLKTYFSIMGLYPRKIEKDT
jgi:hypothetical protein